MFPVNIPKLSRIAFLYNNSGGYFWQSCFNFDHKLSWNVARIILYYHVEKQFLPGLNWLVTCFRFQNMFWKNIYCFQFWWKTYTKHCTSSYVISRIKRLYSLALCGWSGAFNFRVWFGEGKNPDFDFVLLFLLCWIKSHLFCVLSPVVAASCSNYIDPRPCRWF